MVRSADDRFKELTDKRYDKATDFTTSVKDVVII